MGKKATKRNFDQILDLLRAQSFAVSSSAAAPGAMLIAKHGAAAVLAPGRNADEAAVFAATPGALVNGQLARLLDRGYQKFLHTSQFEIPATAAQLESIHQFSEELKQVAGAVDFFNEGLGTTSDLYQYDRRKGREAAQHAPSRPWERAGSH